MNEVTDRVARGAAWLDDKYPQWYSKIDLSTLDLSNCTMCVLGQVYTGVIPTEEQGQILAQAIRSVVEAFPDGEEYAEEYRLEVLTGSYGGYQILTDFHELPNDGEWHGFVASAARDNLDVAREAAEYQALLDEWTRVIISKRLADHPDVHDLTVRLTDLRVPAAA